MSKAKPGSLGRFLQPNRIQTEMRMTDLDSLIGPEDRARQIWAYVEHLDLSEFRAEVKSIEGRPGRDAIDPSILLSVWLMAHTEAIGSARKIAELCDKHHSYLWLCGGVSVGYRTLSNFRMRHEEKLEGLLTNGLAILEHAELINYTRVAQDGMRIRAGAGSNTFRTKPRLEKLQAEALEHVRKLRQELEEDPGACSRRQAAAQIQAADDRVARLNRSLEEAERIAEHLKARASDGRAHEKNDDDHDSDATPSGGVPAKKRRKEIRVSTTDPEARIMKFASGGFRPGFNAQFATDVATHVIVGVAVTNNGSDANQIEPMLQQVQARTGRRPKEVLADSGYCSKQDIDAAAAGGTHIFSPPLPARPSKRPHRRKDSPAVAEWRVRMNTDEGKQTYKQRGQVAERTNADARNRGLLRVTVRGLKKVRTVLLLHAICNNMMRTWKLLPSFATAG